MRFLVGLGILKVELHMHSPPNAKKYRFITSLISTRQVTWFLNVFDYVEDVEVHESGFPGAFG